MMTANEKKLFATRPKTVKAMFQKLRKAGIDTEFLELSKALNSHAAPLGVKTNWSEPESLPAFTGRLTCKPVKGFDYGKRGKPWDNLWWLDSGTGSGDGRGKWQGSFTIWCANVPEVTAEWEAEAKKPRELSLLVRDYENKIQMEMYEAERVAKNEVMKRHHADLSLLNIAADKASSEFKSWRKRNLAGK